MSDDPGDVLSRLRARIDDEYQVITGYLMERSEVFEELQRVQDEVR